MKLTDGQYSLLMKIQNREREIGGKPGHCLVREEERGFSGYKTARGARRETIARLEDLGLIRVVHDHGSQTKG